MMKTSFSKIFALFMASTSLVEASIIHTGEVNLTLYEGMGTSILFDPVHQIASTEYFNTAIFEFYFTGGFISGIDDTPMFHGGIYRPDGREDLFGMFKLTDWSTAAYLESGTEIGGGISGMTQNVYFKAGDWMPGTTGYLGFAIEDGFNHFYYGWALVTYGNDGTRDFVTLHSFAYNDEENAPIVAGAIPEPSVLLLSPIGLLFAALWRRSRAI